VSKLCRYSGLARDRLCSGGWGVSELGQVRISIPYSISVSAVKAVGRGWV
jgi:hypothetical protein